MSPDGSRLCCDRIASPGLASIEGGDLPLTGLTGAPSIDDFATAVSADGAVLGGYSADADGVLWGVRWGCE